MTNNTEAGNLRDRALARKRQDDWDEGDRQARVLRNRLERLLDVVIHVPHGATSAEVDGILFTLPPEHVAGLDAHIRCPHHKNGWINRNVEGLGTLGHAVAQAEDCDGDCGQVPVVTYRGDDPSPADKLVDALVELLGDRGWTLRREE